jgi:hypothetical protein
MQGFSEVLGFHAHADQHVVRACVCVPPRKHLTSDRIVRHSARDWSRTAQQKSRPRNLPVQSAWPALWPVSAWVRMPDRLPL